MDKRFAGLFNLAEAEAIALLDTPTAQLKEEDSRYVAAAQLVHYPSKDSIQALIRAVERVEPGLDNRIVRRKSVETLGRLKATSSLPIIRRCLQENDCFTVENAVWSIGEIGTDDTEIFEEIAELLRKPDQSYRVIIHTLTQFGYGAALERIRPFVDNPDPPIASAAITAVCQLTGDYSGMDRVVGMMQQPHVLGRRLAIQDLINTHFYDAIPSIARCPVSLVFRLRGIRELGKQGIAAGKLGFEAIRPHLEQTLWDDPQNLDLVHAYEQTPELSFLIRQLYETDFGRCYLASRTILEKYPEEAPAALFETFEAEAYCDYGAHYHVVKLFGWLKHQPAQDLLLKALVHPQPQFQKSRAAAAIALGEIGVTEAIPLLQDCLSSKIWDLKYAALRVLKSLNGLTDEVAITEEDDWVIRERFLGTN